MTVPVLLRRQARREFDEAANWYEQRRAGLGVRFVLAVQRVLGAIADNPARYPEVFDDVREGLVPGFPFCVYHRVEAGQVIVLAVFHTSRDPSIWQSRV